MDKQCPIILSPYVSPQSASVIQGTFSVRARRCPRNSLEGGRGNDFLEERANLIRPSRIAKQAAVARESQSREDGIEGERQGLVPMQRQIPLLLGVGRIGQVRTLSCLLSKTIRLLHV